MLLTHCVIHMQSRGAVIAHYPTDAQVIIVDPESDAGKQFVEDWCSEPGKVVLHHDWVTRSIEEGRALLGHDEWGGMRLSTGLNGHVATMNPGQSVSRISSFCSNSPVQEALCLPPRQTMVAVPILQRTQVSPHYLREPQLWVKYRCKRMPSRHLRRMANMIVQQSHWLHKSFKASPRQTCKACLEHRYLYPISSRPMCPLRGHPTI